ncbi:MAG: DinB family protein, partial [Planctomycetaceae bacterium]
MHCALQDSSAEVDREISGRRFDDFRLAGYVTIFQPQDSTQTPSMLELASAQIRFARDYTLTLLDGFPEDAWFTQPAPGCAHLAWQVGHLAMAQYGLCLFRIRGRAEGDLDLMPSTFRKRFSRGTAPDPDPARNPSPAELRLVLDRIHQQVLKELPGFSSELLDEPVELPWA